MLALMLAKLALLCDAGVVTAQRLRAVSVVGLVCAMSVAVIGVCAAGCGGGGRTKQTLTGSINVVFDSGIGATFHAGSRCDVGAGFSNGGEGTNVVVNDPSGTVIGTGNLGAGSYTTSSNQNFCTFAFSVSNIPKEANYTLTVGSGLGHQHYPYDFLKSRNWHVALTLP